MATGHACLARLLADAGGVWGATATKLRCYQATIGVFVRQEPSPPTPGRVLGSLTAVKPGVASGLVPGHACLARLLADTGGVWGATATKLRFYMATIGVFVRQEPSPRTLGRVLGSLTAVEAGGSLWAVSGHACLARLLADTGGVWGATATKLSCCLATIGVFVRQEPSPRTPGRILGPLTAVKPGASLGVASWWFQAMPAWLAFWPMPGAFGELPPQS